MRTKLQFTPLNKLQLLCPGAHLAPTSKEARNSSVWFSQGLTLFMTFGCCCLFPEVSGPPSVKRKETHSPESPAGPPGLTLLPRRPWRPTVGWQTDSHTSLGFEGQTASQKSPNSCQVLQRPPASGRARPHAQAPPVSLPALGGRHLCKACPLAPWCSLQGFRNKHLRRGEESGELP